MSCLICGTPVRRGESGSYVHTFHVNCGCAPKVVNNVGDYSQPKKYLKPPDPGFEWRCDFGRDPDSLFSWYQALINPNENTSPLRIPMGLAEGQTKETKTVKHTLAESIDRLKRVACENDPSLLTSDLISVLSFAEWADSVLISNADMETLLFKLNKQARRDHK